MDWELACSYGRGIPRSAILERKESLPPLNFAMNYESRWVDFQPPHIEIYVENLVNLEN